MSASLVNAIKISKRSEEGLRRVLWILIRRRGSEAGISDAEIKAVPDGYALTIIEAMGAAGGWKVQAGPPPIAPSKPNGKADG